MTVARGPDKLDSNARVEVRVNGVVVGTRRIVDLVGSGISGVDDKGVDDKVTVTLVSGGASPSGAAGGSLDGTYPNPGIASSVAGAGLAETSNVLSVNVGTGLSIVSDAVGITSTGVSAGHYGGAGVDLELILNTQGQVVSAVNTPRPGTGAGGSGAVGPTCFFAATGKTVTSGSEQTYTMTWASATDGQNNTITVPPIGFGLGFVLDNATAAFTASEAGTWFVSAFAPGAAGPATADDYVYVSAVDTATTYSLFGTMVYRSTMSGGTIGFEADASAAFVLVPGDTITVSSGYFSASGSGTLYGGAQITRLG